MKIYGVRVWVDDMAAAKRFYGETLGLKAKWEMAVAVGYDLGIDLIVELDEGGEDSLVGRFVGVSIQVDDIQATYEALKARGVPFLAPPEKMSWGGTLAHFKDPAGNTLTLMQ
ncbi:VOC family protein [Phenylobacterium sp.]|uniref:VOC family protein n=1 Tax=Phenylobacterium sp. TaxID=1871053 RepID=UPI0027176C7D|nr:VOC family protein [Phenylobacterium sp.]MDO8380777.1 VOC family protein [Phenylobacterium sp.]